MGNKKRQSKRTVKLKLIFNIAAGKHTGKLLKVKHSSYGILILIMLMIMPQLGLPKGVLGQQTSSGNVEVTLRVSGPPPTTRPTIDIPTAGTYNHQLMTIAGSCQTGLLVKVFSNDVFVGSTFCDGTGHYSLKATLFFNKNVLRAYHYDNLDQAGPSSDPVTVFITVSSAVHNLINYPLIQIDYSFRGVNPNQTAVWQVKVINGTPPYQLSVDWGDTSKSNLSVSDSKAFNIEHSYKKSGNYIIKLVAKDLPGNSSYLQIGITINGARPAAAAPTASACTVTLLWFKNLGCSSSFIYKLVPLYWLLLVLIVLLWIDQILRTRRREHTSRPVLLRKS